MFGIIKIVLSTNFLIGFITASLLVVGYLYYTGSTINWEKPKKK